MDELLCNLIEETGEIYRRNENGELSNHTFETFMTLRISSAGYRLDPYPNGKSKGELIKRIEELESERDRARNLLRSCVKMGYPAPSTVDEVNSFLAETSTVKS
jgi:hypothetical protein